MRGNVLKPDRHQRVAIGQMALVTHQGAARTLLMVILSFRKTIVDQEHRALLKPVGQGFDKGLALRVDFSQIVMRAFNLQRRLQVCFLERPSPFPGPGL